MLALLAPEERRCWARFRFERHRSEYLAAHALLRLALSRHAAVAPAAWTFAAGPFGRPEIAAPAQAARLRFSLSHTDRLVACAVAADATVGVDVEHLGRRLDVVELAERFFSPRETAAIRRAPARERTARFLEHWTLKEAYVKARGLGLRLPLDRVAFEVSTGPLHASFDPALDDDPARWGFALLRPTAHHVLAVALERRRSEPAAVVVHGGLRRLRAEATP